MKTESTELFAYFTLTHPLMLLFCLGAVIPLLIHYWNKHNHVRMSWAANHYLQLAMKHVVRRFTVLQLLLLILRLVIVLLLAVCLAMPMFEEEYRIFQQKNEKSTLRIIAVDNSFSMQAMEQDRSRMDEAKKKAFGVMDRSAASDAFAVFTFANELVPEVAEPEVSSPAVLDAIEGISGSQKSGNLRNVLYQILDYCASKNVQAFDQIELHVISDFSAKDWSEVMSNKDSRIRKLEESVSIIRHPVSNTDLSNNFVSRIRKKDNLSIVGKNNQIEVEIQNWGGNASQNVVVDLLVGGTVVDSKTTSLSPNRNSRVLFDLVLDEPGVHELVARINDDALNLDNERYEIVNVRPNYNVVFLEERFDSARFLELALEPNESEKSKFRIRKSTPVTFHSVDLNTADLVLIDNVRSLSNNQIDRLKIYVESGGNVLLFLGDLVERLQFNQAWNLDNPWSLGVELVAVQPIAEYQIDPLEFKSEYLLAFRGNPQAGVTGIPIWSYYKAKLNDPSEFEIHLAFQNGDPLLISKRIKKGNFVLFTSSSSSQSKFQSDLGPPNQSIPWNANETVPAFPALLHEILASIARNRNTESIFVGDIAMESMEERNQILSHAMTDKDGELIDVEVKQANGLVSYQSEPLNRSGIYRFEARTNQSELVHLLPVNLDPVESDLRTMSFDDAEESYDDRTPGGSVYYFQLFQFALALLGILLLLETVAGYRFGQDRG